MQATQRASSSFCMQQQWVNPRSCKMVSVALAAIALITGAVILVGAGNMANIGITASGWTCVGLGLVTLNISLCIYCVKKHSLCSQTSSSILADPENDHRDSEIKNNNQSSLFSTTASANVAQKISGSTAVLPTSDVPVAPATTTSSSADQPDTTTSVSSPATTKSAKSSRQTTQQTPAPDWVILIYNTCVDNINLLLNTLSELEQLMMRQLPSDQLTTTSVFDKDTAWEAIKLRLQNMPQHPTTQQCASELRTTSDFIFEQRNNIRLHYGMLDTNQEITDAWLSASSLFGGFDCSVALIAYALGDMKSYNSLKRQDFQIKELVELWEKNTASWHPNDRDLMYIELANNASVNDLQHVSYLLEQVTDPTTRETNCLELAKKIYTKNVKACALKTDCSRAVQACLDLVSSEEQKNAAYKECALRMQEKEAARFWLARISPDNARDAAYIERAQVAFRDNKKHDAAFWLEQVFSDSERDSVYIEFAKQEFDGKNKPMAYQWLKKITDAKEQEKLCLEFAKKEYETDSKKRIKTWIEPIQILKRKDIVLAFYAKLYHKNKKLPDVALGLINAITCNEKKEAVQRELALFDRLVIYL